MTDGIINVYKERGFTSHDVVAKLRGILKMKKIGHTGTLDPEAEGVLPVCLGKATKVCELLTDKEKTYQAVLLLGTVLVIPALHGIFEVAPMFPALYGLMFSLAVIPTILIQIYKRIKER